MARLEASPIPTGETHAAAQAAWSPAARFPDPVAWRSGDDGAGPARPTDARGGESTGRHRGLPDVPDRDPFGEAAAEL